MASSRQTEIEADPASGPSSCNSTLAKALAPEEVRPGQFVTLLQEIAEVPSYFWCRDSALVTPEEMVRIRFIPSASGEPLKVTSVCLPFVLVKNSAGCERPLDLRKYRLARLSKRYAKRAWKTNQ